MKSWEMANRYRFGIETVSPCEEFPLIIAAPTDMV
jgi:hypothetical protein